MQDVYEDIEFLTGESGLMTHQIPNAMKALFPWLKEKVTDQQFWNHEFQPDASGEYSISPMTEEERKLFFERYAALPSLLAGL